MNIESKTRSLVLAAVFIAIIVIMAFTPFGYIPLGFMNATIIHIPVIIGAIILGPKYGGFLGNGVWIYQFVEEYQYAQSHVLCFFTLYQSGRVRREFRQSGHLHGAQDPDWDRCLLCIPGGFKSFGRKKRKENHCPGSGRSGRIINQYPFGNESDLLIFWKRIRSGGKGSDERCLFYNNRNYMHQRHSGGHCGGNSYGGGDTGLIESHERIMMKANIL